MQPVSFDVYTKAGDARHGLSDIGDRRITDWLHHNRVIAGVAHRNGGGRWTCKDVVNLFGRLLIGKFSKSRACK